ncbi:cytochrome P450 4C1-like [Zophobas morio]|uniref:cytochrome P450 4C1-like n=1 Tax=Zophobas morio TaxID=2755281 RepID=UPI003083BBFF
MFLFAALTLLATLWCFQFFWKRKRLYELSWKIPGPMHFPFIGSAYMFLHGDSSEIAKRFMRLFDEHPELSKFWMGPELVFLVSKPEYLEVILNSPGTFEKIELYKYTKPILGDGMISAPVKVWKRHRKILAPALNQKILNEYPEIICQQCNTLIEILQTKVGGEEIDHCRYVTNCAIDIVGETIFGLPISAQVNDANYSHLIDRLVEIVFVKAFRLSYHFDFIFRWTQDYKDQEELVNKIKKVSRGLIEKKKEQLGAQLETEENKKKPLLDLLVEKYLTKEFTEEEVEDEVNTFLLAGTDTNATSISFALTLLGMHPIIQYHLYKEVMEVLGPDRTITLEDLPKLKYTERVIKETLRIFPGAPFIGRVVEEDIILPDLVIPKGSNLAIGYLHLHRSPKYWDDPLKFDPDRFLPERSLNRHPYTWLPFSGGPRNCVGMKYGMMVVKIVVAMVIRKFKVTSSIKAIEDIELTTNIVLKPKNGFKLAFELR